MRNPYKAIFIALRSTWALAKTSRIEGAPFGGRFTGRPAKFEPRTSWKKHRMAGMVKFDEQRFSSTGELRHTGSNRLGSKWVCRELIEVSGEEGMGNALGNGTTHDSQSKSGRL